MKFHYAVSSEKGTIRQENQDNYFLNGQCRSLNNIDSVLVGTSQDVDAAFAVCDGMGGEQAGEIASFLTVDYMKKLTPELQFEQWKEFVYHANRELCQYQESNNLKMGTTFAGIFFKGDCVRAVNVGDSRIYLLDQRTMTQLSIDDTQFRILVDAGVLKKESFASTNSHNILTQGVGLVNDDNQIEPHIREFRLNRDMTFLLCSDGVYGSVSEEQLESLLRSCEEPEVICQKMVNLAMAQGSRDNATALVVRCEIGEEIEAGTKGIYQPKCLSLEEQTLTEEKPPIKAIDPDKLTMTQATARKKRHWGVWLTVSFIILAAAAVIWWKCSDTDNVIKRCQEFVAMLRTKNT